MLKRIPRRLSYANVVATLALVIAVGTGGAYAASKIGSSDLKQIRERLGPIRELSEPGVTVEAGAQCPRRQRIVAWGYSTGGPGSPIVEEIRRAGPRRVRVSAVRPPATPPATIRAIAYCLRP